MATCCGNKLLVRFGLRIMDECVPPEMPVTFHSNPIFRFPDVTIISGVSLGEEGELELDDDTFIGMIADGIIKVPSLTVTFKVKSETDPLGMFQYVHAWFRYKDSVCRTLFVDITSRDLTDVRWTYKFPGATLTKHPKLVNDLEKSTPSVAYYSFGVALSAKPELYQGAIKIA